MNLEKLNLEKLKEDLIPKKMKGTPSMAGPEGHSLWTTPFEEWKPVLPSVDIQADVEIDLDEIKSRLETEFSKQLAPFRTPLSADTLSKRLD